MSASQASCCGWLRSPHLRPARWNGPVGKLDHSCFCAVSVQSKETVSFWVSSSVATKAFAAAATFCVAGLLDARVEAEVPVEADGAAVVAVVAVVPEEHAVARSTTAAAPVTRTARREMV